jgi:hypothetical protein
MPPTTLKIPEACGRVIKRRLLADKTGFASCWFFQNHYNFQPQYALLQLEFMAKIVFAFLKLKVPRTVFMFALVVISQ